MTTAGAIAIELRKLADALDKAPETELPQARFSLYCCSEKKHFLNAAQVLPRPLKKQYPKRPGEYELVYLEHATDALEIAASAYQHAVCTLIAPAMPARFECEPLLTDEELEEAAK